MSKIAIALSAMLLLGACSGSDSTDPGDSAAPVDSSPAESAPPETFFVDEIPVSMTAMFEENEVFSVFAELAALTEYAPLFEAAGEVTVFVPANAAFERLPAGTVDKLRDPANAEVLARLIGFHLLDGKFSEVDIQSGPLVMKSGDEVSVVVGDKPGYLMNITMNGVAVAVGDIYAGRSVAHVLADVLVPSDLDLSAL